MRIALVEDDVSLAQNYSDIFSRADWRVSHYLSRAAALVGIEESLPDVAIIDVGLGAEDEGGFQLCRQLRATPATEHLPIILLTARGEQSDKIYGLNLGADEYCTKDHSTDYLIAVINSLIRRIEMDRQAPSLNRSKKIIGSLEIFPDESRAFWKGDLIDVTVGEYWIIERLVELVGSIKTHRQLMINGIEVSQNTVTSNIKRIRKKFKTMDPTFKAIETDFGRGYLWRKDT
tara:strand:+ start:3643 stop:4338 length:696 start_codon:yes stop_codon:yes gene_type:complete